MMLAVCVTAGTAQRTFSGDLNREHWSVASQHAAPSYQQFPYRQSRFGLPLRLVLRRRLSVVTCKPQHAALLFQGWGMALRVPRGFSKTPRSLIPEAQA